MGELTGVTAGISLKTQELFLIVFVSRYLVSPHASEPDNLIGDLLFHAIIRTCL